MEFCCLRLDGPIVGVAGYSWGGGSYSPSPSVRGFRERFCSFPSGVRGRSRSLSDFSMLWGLLATYSATLSGGGYQL